MFCECVYLCVYMSVCMSVCVCELLQLGGGTVQAVAGSHRLQENIHHRTDIQRTELPKLMRRELEQ